MREVPDGGFEEAIFKDIIENMYYGEEEIEHISRKNYDPHIPRDRNLVVPEGIEEILQSDIKDLVPFKTIEERDKYKEEYDRKMRK